MKKTLLFSLGMLCLWTANAQSVQQNVLVPAGGSNATTDLSLEWTLGDLATGSLALGEGLLTQGFNQPVISVPAKWDPAVPLAVIRMLPNPTSSFVNVVIEDPRDGMYTVSVTDVNGRTTIGNTRLFLSRTRINVSGLAAGTYLVVVYNTAGVRIHTSKLIKL